MVEHDLSMYDAAYGRKLLGLDAAAEQAHQDMHAAFKRAILSGVISNMTQAETDRYLHSAQRARKAIKTIGENLRHKLLSPPTNPR